MARCCIAAHGQEGMAGLSQMQTGRLPVADRPLYQAPSQSRVQDS